MHLAAKLKSQLNQRKQNFRRNVRRERRLFQSICNGTHINTCLRQFRIRRYKTYRQLSTAKLKSLLSIKKASLDTKPSSLWTGALVGAVLSYFVPKIDEISQLLATSASIGDWWSNISLIVLLLFDIIMPCFAWITALFMGISIGTILRFYILFFAVMVGLPIMAKAPESPWVSFWLIVFAILNVYSFIIIALDMPRQCRAIECDVIRDILAKRACKNKG